MIRIYLMSSLDFPTFVSGFTYHHLQIHLPLSLDVPNVVLDLPTVVTRFTYHHFQIYLLSSPDLPTIVSGFTYHCLQNYLPLG